MTKLHIIWGRCDRLLPSVTATECCSVAANHEVLKRGLSESDGGGEGLSRLAASQSILGPFPLEGRDSGRDCRGGLGAWG
jgi:hypothetical protein